jgi:enoyl-CoA hydratase/carnithine racemase
MSYEFISVEKKDHITALTINRPEVMNAINPLVSLEMEKAIDEFDEDSDQWIFILTGAGDRAFSAGNDLKFQAAQGGEKMRELTEKLKCGFGGITMRFDCFKPMIAAVNGFALGGGFELALACDIIIAAENATFGFPEPRVGLIAMAGGVQRLPRHIPYHAAMEMLMTSRRITAEEAKGFGLVAKVVPPSDLMKTAYEYAAEIMKGAPISIRATKEAVLKGLEMKLDDAVPKIFPMIEVMLKSEDYIEGPKAFSEKRPPNWKGK